MTQRRFVYQRPPLYPKQEAAIFCKERFGCVEASTKSGKTHGCIAWIFEQAITGPKHSNHWWLAPVREQARIAFQRIKNTLTKGTFIAHERPEKITLLANGANIVFKSGDEPDLLYGDDVYSLVVDEASRLKEEAWLAARSTLVATQGPARLIGNVRGRKNFFYKMCRRAQEGEPDYHFAKITAADAVEAGVMEQSELDQSARDYTDERVFRELFYAEANEDGGNPFGLTAIRNCIAKLSNDSPYAWGWDLAKSVDWTVGICLDRAGKAVAVERWQGVPWPETMQRIRRITGRVPALVDSTGVGDPILEFLQREGGRNFEGFKFTSPSKQQLMEGLARSIQSKDVTFPDGPIVSELEAFEYEYIPSGVRYSSPDGMHDDCVCALALADAKKRQRRSGGIHVVEARGLY